MPNPFRTHNSRPLGGRIGLVWRRRIGRPVPQGSHLGWTTAPTFSWAVEPSHSLTRSEFRRPLAPHARRRSPSISSAAVVSGSTRVVESELQPPIPSSLSPTHTPVDEQGRGNPVVRLCGSRTENLRDFYERFQRLNIRSSPELDVLVEQAQPTITGIRVGYAHPTTPIRRPNVHSNLHGSRNGLEPAPAGDQPTAARRPWSNQLPRVNSGSPRRCTFSTAPRCTFEPLLTPAHAPLLMPSSVARPADCLRKP